MKDELTAGQFQAMTGLSTKALRLYAERGIVTPASVDPFTGYRLYDRSQLHHGATVDLLRRAQVPLAELGPAVDFPFEEWRQKVQLRRTLEDFSLDVAERVAAFSAEEFTATSTFASALDWAGVIIDLNVPEDDEEKIAAFAGLAVDTPAVEKAFEEALGQLGLIPGEVSWTAIPDASLKNSSTKMVLARSGVQLQDDASKAVIADRVRSTTGVDVTAVSGRLPDRLEVTFAQVSAGGPDAELSPVDEAASGYLQVLAFEDYLTRNRLTALGSRQVVWGGGVFSGDDHGGPVSVFDVEYR